MNKYESDAFMLSGKDELLEESAEKKFERTKKTNSRVADCDEDYSFIAEVINSDPDPDSPEMTGEKVQYTIEEGKVMYYIVETLDGKPLGFTDFFHRQVKSIDGREVSGKDSMIIKSEIKILNEADRGKKYGTEAMFYLLDELFENSDKEYIYATIKEKNIRSRKFHESLGYTECQTSFEKEIVNEGSVKYVISREAWQERRKKILDKLNAREM